MRNKPILMSALLAGALALAGGTAAFAQTPVAQNRVGQQVVINGLRVDAAYVLAAGGGIQSYSCPAPQQYTAPDGSSQGWACFDSATNVWLLSALPPQQQAASAPVVVPQVIQQPVYQAPVVYQYPVIQPTIIYSQPSRYVYGSPYYYGGYYSPSTAFGVAGINAAGRIAAAVIETSRFHDDHRNFNFRGYQGHGRR
jgi:hypothetical protein